MFSLKKYLNLYHSPKILYKCPPLQQQTLSSGPPSAVWEVWGWLHLYQLVQDGSQFLLFFFKGKKNALRDFAAFHFMSTNKRTKKPFWREKWGVSKKKEPLKNLGEIKRVGKESGGQEGTQTELKNQSDSTTNNERII